MSTGPIYEAVRHFLDQTGWPVVSAPDGKTFRIAVEGTYGSFGVLVEIREARSQVLVWSVCPSVVPQSLRLTVAEYLSRLNWGMPIGNFELDFLTGEIRFRTSLATDDPLRLDLSLVRPLLLANVATMDQHLTDIAGVLRGDVTADAPDALSELARRAAPS